MLIVRFIVKNIFEKKSRTFLVVLSILISTAMSLATLVTSSNLQQMYSKQLTKYFGDADIMITKEGKSDSPFFDPDLIEDHKDKVDYSISEVNGLGLYQNKNEYIRMNLFGVDLDEINEMITITYEEKKDLSSFSDEKIIVSKIFAEKYNLKNGDTVELEIVNEIRKLEIVAIAQPDGIFMESGQELVGIVPRDLLADYYHADKNVSLMYVKSKDGVNKEELMKELSTKFEDCEVGETITENEMKSYIDRMSTSFRLLMIAVLVICIFIIYSSFKVISIERLPIIGTFRSVGATKLNMNRIICLESILYGCIGGVLGCGFGVIVSRLMVRYTTPEWLNNSGSKFNISFSYMVIAFVLAIVVSFVSSIFPILKVSNFPLKNIILNNLEETKSKSNVVTVIGLIFVGTAIIIPRVSPKEYALVFHAIAAVLGAVAMILLVPGILSIFIHVLDKINKMLGIGVSSISVKNLRGNKSVINSISLLSIGIAVLILIQSFGDGLITRITNYYLEQTYEVQMVMDGSTDDTLDEIQDMKDVTGCYGIYESENVSVTGKNEKIRLLMGVKDNFIEYYNYQIKWNKDSDEREFLSGRNIVISDTLANVMKAKSGDVLILKTESGEQKYTITGEVNALQSFVLLPEKYLKDDMNLTEYSRILIKTEIDEENLCDSLRNKYIDNKPQVNTIEELKKSDLNANMQIILAMKAFSFMVLLIGTVGVINNFIISFIERRRTLALFRSIGMNKKQVIQMVFVESVMIGIIAGIVGILGGILLLFILPGISEAIGLKVNIDYNLKQYALYFGLSVLLSIIASISPTFKSSKVNIIQSIKYD